MGESRWENHQFAVENGPLIDGLPINSMVIVYSVKLPEGTVSIQNLGPRWVFHMLNWRVCLNEPENCLVNPTFLLESKCSQENLYNNRSLI